MKEQIAEIQSTSESWNPQQVLAWAFGTFGKGARITVKPLLSFRSVILGRLSGRAGPGGGGVFC